MNEEEKQTLTGLTGHIQMTDAVGPTTSNYDSDSSSASEPSRDSLTMTHTMTMTMTHTEDTSAADTVAGHPKNWEWEDVQAWLTRKGLAMMIPVFAEGATEKEGTDGEELLGITFNKLFDDSGAYRAGEKLDIGSMEEAENDPRFIRFFRELTKLQLKANESASADFTEKEMKVNDVIELKRRILIFIEKWDRILWIENFVDNYNKLPTNAQIAEELGVSVAVAEVYLHYYENEGRLKKKEVDELLLDFNVYNDCVIFWFVIVQILTTVQTKSIWLLFNKVAELTPGNVAIELLDRYKEDLTRYEADRLEVLAQNIVIGSQYPVCASLRLSKWFMEIAEYDVARGHIFEEVSESFIDAALDTLNFIESDHMATIILEVKSDIEDMNALEMALEFELTKFVSDQRIERVTTSVMNDFEFLRPKNQDEAFQIDPLSTQLIWRKMFYSQFYFTPLGTYCVEVLLYFVYLTLFTYLSVQQFRVFDEMTTQEMIFWVFNAGFVANELQGMISNGLNQYFSEPQNYFDALVSGLFVGSICIRAYALYVGVESVPGCDTMSPSMAPTMEPTMNPTEMGVTATIDNTVHHCWVNSPLNSAFVILWGCATITLWLRIINFTILSHSLGPMVTMIFKMMADIATFFKIMIILFMAFAMALMFILGDVIDQFETPISAAITLFRALLGDFEFDGIEEAEIATPIFYFAYGIMLLYLVIGSLVLLNLLIAMMAKTFDTIEEDTTAAIIFARFRLALDRDTTASLMPPPLNILAMFLLLMVYIVEGIMNAFKRIGHCCCGKGKPFQRFDLAVNMMPKFMRERKLELDDQILYENCHRYWTITTNKGPTKCKIVKYKSEIGHHVMRFYNDKNKGIKVSVGNSVDKKHQWQLDLFELHELGLIEFEQFDSVYVTSEFASIAHAAMKKADDTEGLKSPYWICGFCRGYVKGSRVSLKRLGYMLNVSDIEMKIVQKVAPDICSNCYRVRLERPRFDLVWEIISYWIWIIIVFPLLFTILFMVILIGLLQDTDELARAVELIKAKIISAGKDTVGAVEDTGNIMADLLDDGKLNNSNVKDDDKDNKYVEDPKYVGFHYGDTQLISTMNEMDDDNTMFDVAVRDDVWELLADAKNDIDAFLLRNKINNHIMFLSTEDEMSKHEFYDDFINFEGLKKNGGDFLWEEYFLPLATTIFERVQKLREEYVPLHLFRRYPFDIQLVMDDFADFFDAKENFETPLKDVKLADIVEALNELRSLNCDSEDQRTQLIKSVQNDKDPVWQIHHEDTLMEKFTRYLHEVQGFFQDTRTIKNMLRDVNTAIVERGADSAVFLDQLHFLFEDLRNVTLAIPFFNSMRVDDRKEELKVELWTIRNTLQSLYFLNNVVRKYLLQNHSRLFVSKQNLLDMIYKLFVNDIIDPTGITDLIATDDAETIAAAKGMERLYSDAGDVIKEQSQDHEPTESFLNAQKSTIAISAHLEEHDDEESDDEEARHQIILERMELFQKGAITAEAVRDEVSSIFENIMARRTEKITESTILFYRRNGLKKCRLLQDDEALRYIFEQLSRFATFFPAEMKSKCTPNLLKRIFYNTLMFGDHHGIDDETIPKVVRNDFYIQQLYDHLYDLYRSTDFNSIIMEQTLEYMTLEDVLSMIMLYERTFSTLNAKIVDDGDLFVVTHDVFCKFVDSDFDPDQNKAEWANKTVAASNLFQSVLDEQQQFVTLGQIRQTVDKLMNDIAAMKCGELTRIMNHLHAQFKNDNLRCKNDRIKYVQFLESQGVAGSVEDQLASQLTFASQDGDDKEPDLNRKKTKTKKMKNPALAFKHISKSKWTAFMDKIAANFQMNIPSHTVNEALHKEEAKDDNKEDDYTEKKDDDDDEVGGKKIIDSILDNTNFDIIKFTEDDAKYDGGKTDKDAPKKKKKATKYKKRDEVFDVALSFCAGRITLQQLFQFSKLFRSFLRKNKLIHEMMQNYDKILNAKTDASLIAEESFRKTAIPSTVEKFKKQYFGESENADYDAEVNWLFLGCENRYDLCHKMHPFWSGSIIVDIYSFMESTEQIQGNYELKEAEFGQLKHSLHVNGDLAVKLFHIIRFKLRTLSWKQIFNYFKFLLKMKYSVQKAILKAKKAEDETVSLDGAKILLKIQLNDESVWLFNKVDSLHGAKVTWKQIRKYLKKTITVRDEMRDFFADTARDREFEEKKAEIVNAIHDNVENNMESTESNQEEMLSALAAITKQLNALQAQIKKGGVKDKPKEVNLIMPHVKSKVGFHPDIKEDEEMQFNDDGGVKGVGDLKPIGDKFLSTPL